MLQPVLAGLEMPTVRMLKWCHGWTVIMLRATAVLLARHVNFGNHQNDKNLLSRRRPLLNAARVILRCRREDGNSRQEEDC